MGLACSNIRLLTLTSRKADCEYNISIDSMHKMALTREQSELSKQYYAKLKNKNISYYANNQYNKMTYQYLMGYSTYMKNFGSSVSSAMPIKEDNSMILTDYNGLVVMNKTYKEILTSVLGADCIDASGRGKTFSKDKIPALIQKACGLSAFSEEDIKNCIEGSSKETDYSATTENTLTGEKTGTTTVDSTEQTTSMIQKAVDFYYPIFVAASANGWTTEYNNDMERNDDYISDALVTGTFQLAQVNEYGGYDPDASLTYFVLEGLVFDKQNSDAREEITAWYNSEKERITEKENYLDIEMSDLSTELEAINTEIQSVKSLIDDNIQTVFDWGSS